MEESAIGVNPGFQGVSLRPGETYHGTFKVVNPTPDESNTVNYKILTAPFSVLDEEYSINFETKNDFNQMSDWITVDNASGSVSGKESLEIPFTINVPRDVPGGGQYAAILVRIVDHESPSENEYAIGTNRQVASIIYATVEGKTRKEGQVLENKVEGFVFDSPVNGNILIENSGNVHFNAQTHLQVFPIFSEEEIYSSEESPKNNIVLPKTTLSTSNTWDETPEIGVFRVVQTVSFLDNVSTTEKTVFVCPIWFLILVIVFICSGIFWIFTNSRARKKARKRAKTYSGPYIRR